MVKVITYYKDIDGEGFANEVPVGSIDDGKVYVTQNLDNLSKRIILPSTKTEEGKTMVVYNIYNFVKIEIVETTE